MTVTCDKFLDDLKLLITVPANQSLMEDDDILSLADFENRSTVTPLIESTNQGFFVTRSPRYPILANKSSYPIPPRAVGRKLKDLALTDAGGQYWSFPMVDLVRGQRIQFGSIPFGFMFMGDKIQVLPPPTSDTGYGITFAFSVTPGRFVKLAAVGVVDSVVGDDITLVGVPPTFTPNRRIDVINGEPGNWYKGVGLKITNINSNTLTVEPGTVPEDIEPGDFIPLSGESPVIQLPEEAIPLLLNATSKRVLAAISDFEAKKELEKEIKTQEETVARLLQPRMSSQPTRLVNPFGLGARRGFRNRGFLFRD